MAFHMYSQVIVPLCCPEDASWDAWDSGSSESFNCKGVYSITLCVVFVSYPRLSGYACIIVATSPELCYMNMMKVFSS